MGDETYQGWANRETWAMHLNLSNDEYLYDGARLAITEAIRRAGEDAGAWTGANALEEWVRGSIDHFWAMVEDGKHPSRLWAGLLQDVGSVWRVDWREVADGLMDEG